MGRQINFYMEKELHETFIQELFQKEFLIIVQDFEKRRLITCNKFEMLDSSSYIVYLYKHEFGELFIDNDCEYRLDHYKSPVIELARTSIRNEEMIITRGRLWVETKHHGGNGEIILKDESLTKEYNSLVRWIKKHTSFQEITKGEYSVKEYVTDYIKGLADNGFRLM